MTQERSPEPTEPAVPEGSTATDEALEPGRRKATVRWWRRGASWQGNASDDSSSTERRVDDARHAPGEEPAGPDVDEGLRYLRDLSEPGRLDAGVLAITTQGLDGGADEVRRRAAQNLAQAAALAEAEQRAAEEAARARGAAERAAEQAAAERLTAERAAREQADLAGRAAQERAAAERAAAERAAEAERLATERLATEREAAALAEQARAATLERIEAERLATERARTAAAPTPSKDGPADQSTYSPTFPAAAGAAASAGVGEDPEEPDDTELSLSGRHVRTPAYFFDDTDVPAEPETADPTPAEPTGRRPATETGFETLAGARSSTTDAPPPAAGFETLAGARSSTTDAPPPAAGPETLAGARSSTTDAPPPEAGPETLADARSSATGAPEKLGGGRPRGLSVGWPLPVLLSLATLAVGYLAWLERTSTWYAVAAGLAVLTYVVFGASRKEGTRVTVRGGVVAIVNSQSRHEFDLNGETPRIEVQGRPTDRRWRALVHRTGMTPFVIDRSLVDPGDFMRVLEKYRPGAGQNREE